MFSFWGKKPVSCELDLKGANVELALQVPLNPSHDAAQKFDAHQWGTAPRSDDETKGQRTHTEVLDGRNHQTPLAAYPTDARGFHAVQQPEDRINTTYENMLADEMALSGKPEGKFQTKWQKKLAYHHGLFQPRSFGPAKTADDVRIATNEFADKVNLDDPEDACKYILQEEMRCLQVYQYEMMPQEASKRCVKWFDEYQKCQWDQHKFNNGYQAIEGPALMKKRRPYIGYPDFKYA